MNIKINTKKGIEYTLFSDESHITASRYRSIACLTFPTEHRTEIEQAVAFILASSNISELKWHKLASAKHRLGCIKIVDFIVDNINRYSIRLDIIIWDTYDSRHSIKNRNDSANFARMYFHLLKFVMKNREVNSRWNIYADENTIMDWGTLKESLKSVGDLTKVIYYPLEDLSLISRNYDIIDFEDLNSKEHQLIQISDLFSGMAVYSINSFRKYLQWIEEKSPQLQFFDNSENFMLSNSDKERLTCLKHFINKCQNQKLGVSIKTKKRLWTPKPTNPINFWSYEPQNELDKAPTKCN